MNELIKLIVLYKKEKKDDIFEEIYFRLEKIIKYYKFKVPNEYLDDFNQELLINLINVIEVFKINKIIQIHENYFTKEKFDKLTKGKFENISLIFKNEFIEAFNSKYTNELFINSFKSKKSRKVFLEELNLFCNENQFKKYLKKSFNNLQIQYNKKINKIKSNELYILNEKNAEDEESINLLIDESTYGKKRDFDKSLLTEKDIKFLKEFFEDETTLNGTEVARKLGVTQQAVSIRLSRIRKKYYKNYNKLYN